MENKEIKIESQQLILIFLVFAILVLGAIVMYIVNLTQEDKNAKSLRDLSNNLIYRNSASDVYQGELEPYKITNKVDILFETYLPSITEDIMKKDDAELESYFDKDSDRIYLSMGITDKTEFVQFAKKLQRLDCSLEKVQSVTYLEGSYELVDEGEYIQFKVFYENGNSLNCKLFIAQDENEEVIFKFELL